MAYDWNGSGSFTHDVSISFQSEVQRVENLLLFTTEEHRNFRNQMVEKRNIYFKLCAEQLSICESINKYNKAWFEHAIVHAESYERAKLNNKVRALLQTLENWRAKLDACKDIFRSYFRRMKTYDAETRIAMEKLRAARSLTELERIYLPNLAWTVHIVDPGIEQLSYEWDHLALESKIRNCHLRMQQLIDSDGQNARNLQRD